MTRKNNPLEIQPRFANAEFRMNENEPTPPKNCLTDDVNRVRACAMELLSRVSGECSVSDMGIAVEKAAGAIAAAAKMSAMQSEADKLSEEIAQLRRENSTAVQRERSKRIQDYVTLLSPIVTVIALAATLVTQNWQFVRTEREKRDQALDSQWQDAVKSISASGSFSPGVVSLFPFLQSGKYKQQAKEVAVVLLSNSTDTVFFHSLFGAAVGSLGWEDADRVIRIDRAAYARADPLYKKVWNADKQIDELDKLSNDERAIYYYAQDVIPHISANIGALLRSPRPAGYQLDMSSIYVKDANWQGVDLKGFDLSGAFFLRVDLNNADLSGITRFDNCNFQNTAWWDVKTISPEFLSYLEKYYPYSAQEDYGPSTRLKRFSRKEYDAAMTRLHGSGVP